MQLNMFISSSMVQSVPGWLSLVLEGARTNIFGLGCPLYCHQPSLASSFLIYLLGFFSGLATAILGFWTLWTYLGHHLFPSSDPHQPPRPASRYSALAGYLHEQQNTRRRGH